LNIDVTLVRIAFVLLTFLTSGAWILAYFVMVLVIPNADTPRQRQEAFGRPPFTAQELLNRAHMGYETFKNSKEWRTWKRELREQRKQLKKNWRHQQHMQHHGAYRSPFWEFMQSLLGMVWFLIFVFGIWFLYHHVPMVHEFIDLLPVWISQLAAKIGIH
jgi:hypothetical protein